MKLESRKKFIYLFIFSSIDISELVFLSFFLIEMCLKLYGLGATTYFRSKFNKFDSVVNIFLFWFLKLKSTSFLGNFPCMINLKAAKYWLSLWLDAKDSRTKMAKACFLFWFDWSKYLTPKKNTRVFVRCFWPPWLSICLCSNCTNSFLF